MKRLQIKSISSLFLALAVSVSGLSSLKLNAQGVTKEKVAAQIMLDRLESWHYQPQELDDQLSERIFKLFFDRLDYRKEFFLKSDIEKFKARSSDFDDELKNASEAFVDEVFKALDQRIEEVRAFYPEILKQTFDFNQESKMELDPDKRDYCSNAAELRSHWEQSIRLQITSEYLDILEEKARENDKSAKSDSGGDAEKDSEAKSGELKIYPEYYWDPEIEKEARAVVERRLKRSFDRMLEQRREDRMAIFLSSVANSFDPHTEFFPPQSKEDFDIGLTGTLEGIGAVLQEDDGYIRVKEIVPGGAAWRQKELGEEDLIIEVAQGDEEPVSVVEMRVRDAVKLIRGKKGTEVRLTVKKPNGESKVIPIIREVVVMEDSYAKAAVIENQKLNNKFGYIYLPTFYHDPSEGGRDSAQDIRNALVQLKEKQVDGVILDLRNNGGGLLDDAVKMAGLFFKKGPVVQVRDRVEQGKVLEDTDPEEVYDGELVVMINVRSASASEIVAAALQDYGRAILVGSKSSFGKGTVQMFLDLDRYLRFRFQNLRPLGALKLTIQTFYRINGASTQYRGVESDIVLPDIYGAMEIGERELDYSLPFNQVAPVEFQKWDRMTYDHAMLQENSSTRIANNQTFAKIIQEAQMLRDRKEDTLKSIRIEDLYADRKKMHDQSEELDELRGSQDHIVVEALPSLESNKESLSDRLKQMDEWSEGVNKDVYIEEAMNVLHDMIAQKGISASK
jgi:carboxyl-terminal processing protease